MSFEFNDKYKNKLKALLPKYPEKRALTIPCLWMAQHQEGWISTDAMAYIAEQLEIPPTKVYEVATFYTMFNLNPMGKYHFQICGTISCELRGKDEIIEAIDKELGIKPGQTTADKMFTLTQVECLGHCGTGPVIQVNEDFYENMTTEKTLALIEELKK